MNLLAALVLGRYPAAEIDPTGSCVGHKHVSRFFDHGDPDRLYIIKLPPPAIKYLVPIIPQEQIMDHRQFTLATRSPKPGAIRCW